MRKEHPVVGYAGKSGKVAAYKCVWRGPGRDGRERAKLVSLDGQLEFFVDASRLTDPPPRREEREMCAECGDYPGVVMCSDSSGIRALCCRRCAGYSPYDRSFA